ncbi:proline/serine-rich coiled-coil protein 1 isoform X2 [Phascolarctos cinereus]|uniref:Proline/serine-rich coiled-coil protein 1 isoform X1 n=1 Tax=Phascolarctos cinereus TaxID=38626 RepID=A0A6P5LKJ7_PHACI|nr:proline/serine-rich coiled-coil protein 1 isoform X1 [Phascolarctos cinereus]XP_020856326.1 proline/serine-rich coiled-coil protein 1 isoform X2 [Phascolarctos cinereus]
MENLEEDVKFIVDETFDFSVPSPSDSREEEEAPDLVIPERPPRRGLAHRSDLNVVAEEPQGLRLSLGPLSPEKLEEILDEANRLAARLEQCALQEKDTGGDGKGRRVKASPRRETFVVKNSPVRALLPTVSSPVRGASSPGGLTPRLRSSEKKGSSRALRATSGKKPSSTKKEAPTGSVLPTTRSQSSPISRIAPPTRGKAGPSGRAPAAGLASATRPALALQLPPNTLQRPARTQGPAVRPSRLPTPTAIPKPASQALLCSRSPLSGKGSLPLETAPPRKGPSRPSTAGHRGPSTPRSNLPVSAASRNHLQSPKKVTIPGLTR